MDIADSAKPLPKSLLNWPFCREALARHDMTVFLPVVGYTYHLRQARKMQWRIP